MLLQMVAYDKTIKSSLLMLLSPSISNSVFTGCHLKASVAVLVLLKLY